MASLIQDLGLVEAALGDLAEFAAGQPITTPSLTIGADEYSASVVHLPNGPAAPYQTFSGGILNIIGTVLADYAAISAGAPIVIAEKFGNTWYGITLTKIVKAAA